jgi:hypothetical protein
MPLLALNRKDTGAESIGSSAPKTTEKAAAPENAFTMAVSWPVRGLPAPPVVWRVFFTRTGTHFARKRYAGSRNGYIAS